MNRMSEVAGSGRTVLFVSHNFAAVAALTVYDMVKSAGKGATIDLQGSNGDFISSENK